MNDIWYNIVSLVAFNATKKKGQLRFDNLANKKELVSKFVI